MCAHGLTNLHWLTRGVGCGHGYLGESVDVGVGVGVGVEMGDACGHGHGQLGGCPVGLPRVMACTVPYRVRILD